MLRFGRVLATLLNLGHGISAFHLGFVRRVWVSRKTQPYGNSVAGELLGPNPHLWEARTTASFRAT